MVGTTTTTTTAAGTAPATPITGLEQCLSGRVSVVGVIVTLILGHGHPFVFCGVWRFASMKAVRRLFWAVNRPVVEKPVLLGGGRRMTADVFGPFALRQIVP